MKNNDCTSKLWYEDETPWHKYGRRHLGKDIMKM